MKSEELTGLMRGVGVVVKETVAPIFARLKALEDRQPERGPQGERGEKGMDGINGKDGNPGAVGEPGPRGETGPAGEKGMDGRDGADGERGERGADGAQGPQGERGEPGPMGPAGRDGIDGQKGADGINGKDGRDGIDGRDGLQGERGEKGDPGEIRPLTAEERKEMIESLQPYLEAFYAKWALEFERRAVETMTRAIESIPKPKDGRDGIDGAKGIDGTNGRDGVDGLSVDSFDAQLLADGRTLAIKLADGVKEITRTIKLPTPLDRGVWKADGAYEKGDAVTYGGSLWIAQADSPGAPGKGDGWRLAVKRGRDAERAE